MSSSAPPPLSTLSQRLTTASTLILERSRVVSTLKLPASASTDAQIVRALTFVRDGLKRVQGGGGDDEEVKELGSRYDRLVEMMEEQDEIGRLKVRDLKRPREVIEER
jgi:syntaxin 8